MKDLRPKYGVVAVIDALGIRNATIEESIHFVKNIQNVIERLPNFMSAYLANSHKHTKYKEAPPKLTTFGDTFIFSWEIKDDELTDYLADIGCFLSFAVMLGLDQKMAFRGAVSVGNYIESGSTVLGPAIADAAAWYDSSEMIGVIATPYCGNFLNDIDASRGIFPMELVKYSVPLKHGVSRNLWTTCWPYQLQLTTTKREKKELLQAYYKVIQKFPIPKGTEDKFFNTEKFVRWFLKIDEA